MLERLLARLRGKTNYTLVPENTIADEVWKELKEYKTQPVQITGRMVALKTLYPYECSIFEGASTFFLDTK
jgi:hypothetical protein